MKDEQGCERDSLSRTGKRLKTSMTYLGSFFLNTLSTFLRASSETVGPVETEKT